MAFIPFAILLLFALVMYLALRQRTTPYAAGRDGLPPETRAALQQWQCPPELNASPAPRAVEYTAKAKGIFTVFALVIAAGIAFTWFIAIPEYTRRQDQIRQLGIDGVTAEGTIQKKSSSGGRSTTYEVTYGYRVNGVDFQSQAEVSDTVYSQLNIGSTASLQYSRSRPEISRLDVEINVSPWLPFLTLIPLLFMLILPSLIARDKKVLESGRPLAAVVTGVRVVKGGRRVSYVYVDQADRILTSSSFASRSDAPEVGEAVTILSDPDQPERTAFYPCRFVRVAQR